MLRIASLILGCVLILPLGGSTTVWAQDATPASTAPVAASGEFAGLVDIGDGRRLYLECRGAGSPTVILEAGAGNDADTWDTVWSPGWLGADRGAPRAWPPSRGSVPMTAPGRSSTSSTAAAVIPCPCRAPRATIVADLHALLTAAAIPGPYVLAGHSFGGLVIRLYAATYPDDVVGLVLIDAAHEDYYDGSTRHVLTAAQLASIHANGRRSSPITRTSSGSTSTPAPPAMRAAAAASPLRPLPLVVLTHGLPLGLACRLPRRRPGGDLAAAAGRTWPRWSRIAVSSSPSRAGTSSPATNQTWSSRRFSRSSSGT